ncbi:LLM class F420-dependent oxidoreductase [Candidatus Bathyarchaeota archaeon]|nr:LLM class F420-dependent oxidoreductase [Candidatus Bathyarchaeota archaeon]MBL7079396.1 LLM class F420-dependent oxidoreductase [Candidatus Bathyarchaeota archaeon]
MKIGLQVPWFNWPGSPENTGPILGKMARAADDGGLSTLWAMDHFYQVRQGFGPAGDPMLEGYTTLAYLAALTRRVRLGLMVTSSFYRYPGVLVKTVTTLDVLTGGRAILGIGAGWDRLESAAMGVPFPPSLNERMGRFEETLKIVKHMWSGDTRTFEGEYHRLEEPLLSPMPLSKPHPPILIGGEGEKKTLKYVALYGDACNLHIGTPLEEFSARWRDRYENRVEVLTGKLDVLRRHCENVGRDYGEIEKTTLGTIKIAPDAMSAGELVELCEGLAEIGIDQAIFNMPNAHEITPIETIGKEVIPVVANM